MRRFFILSVIPSGARNRVLSLFKSYRHARWLTGTQKAESSKQKAASRKQKAESRKQKAEALPAV